MQRLFTPLRWSIFTLLVLLASFALGACSGTTSAQLNESIQLSQGTNTIVGNQPVPNLGGYSLERDLVSQLILLRNQKLSTWTYMFQFGTLVEICPSMGYPIPYATQLTAPEVYYSQGATIPQSEPNTLYSPDSADASWVMCVQDGLMVPQYYEDKVFAIPYRIKADRKLEPVEGAQGVSSVKVDATKAVGNMEAPAAPTATDTLTNPYPEDPITDTISPTE